MKVISLFILLFIFTGCSMMHPVETKVIHEEKKVYITPPASVLTDSEIPTYPDKEAFMNMSCSGRVSTMNAYSMELLKVIGKSNIRMRSLRTWVDEQQKIKDTKK